MFNKDLYKQEVFEKYSNISRKRNDNFYNKKIYKNNLYITKIHTLCSILVICISFFGIAYAGYEVHNYFISEKGAVSNTPSSVDYAFYKDMKQEHGIYYKKIETFKEYEKYKKMWSNLLEMTKDDFINNFMIITAAENSDTINLEISDIYADNGTIYLEFYETDNNYNSSIVIGTKISRELNRDTIKIRLKKDLAIIGNKYIKITDIPSNYSVEDAISDGCMVIENNKVISNNINEMKKFISNSKNGIEGNIRIYSILPQGIVIKDIQFINNKYKFNSVNLNDITDISSKEYIDIRENSFRMGETKYTSIDITNEIDNGEWDVIAIFTE